VFCSRNWKLLNLCDATFRRLTRRPKFVNYTIKFSKENKNHQKSD
jgi:hypothetical protein